MFQSVFFVNEYLDRFCTLHLNDYNLKTKPQFRINIGAKIHIPTNMFLCSVFVFISHLIKSFN